MRDTVLVPGPAVIVWEGELHNTSPEILNGRALQRAEEWKNMISINSGGFLFSAIVPATPCIFL